jgi:dephospho-CoA kinase
MAIVAIVGMPGCGKTETAQPFIKKGFEYVRFGQIVVDEVKKRQLPVEEDYERQIREELRERYGMAAMAALSVPKIENALKAKKDVLIDGLYSWEELLVLRKRFPKLKLLAVYASPATRYKRLAKRKARPLLPEEAAARDRAEIENLNKGGPIAMADFTVLNDGPKKELQKQVESVLRKLRKK